MMFDRNVLTIQDWTRKALDIAVAAAIDRQETMKQHWEAKLARKLMTLTEAEINTRILHKMGPAAVARLDDAARESSANPKLYKVLQLVAMLTRSESAALLRSR